MAPYHQTLGQLLKVDDPVQENDSRVVIDHWANNSLLAAYKCTERQRWALHPTLVNARVGPHSDKNDAPWAMVAMTVGGGWHVGGNIVMPQLGKQFALRPGGVLFINARLLHHWVSPYEGQQLSNVHSMHRNMYNSKAAEQAVPSKKTAQTLERKRRREAMEPTEVLDDSRGFLMCKFCQGRYDGGLGGLTRHLSRWRADPAALDDKDHKSVEVREYASEQRWGSVAKSKKKRHQ